MISKEFITRRSQELLQEMTGIRRDLHRRPELSYAEYATADYICNFLSGEGIEYIKGVSGTGIIGIIRGKREGKGLTIGLRADMDALPITEAEGSPFRSLNEGVMHACGHDAHMAMLMGAAKMLNELRDRLPGTILLVFQPGEEKAPGGARLMLETGIFNDLKPDMFIAQHVLPEIPSGIIGFHSGPYMASCDEIYLSVKGRGGHAAQPSQYTDQILIASDLVMRLKENITPAAGSIPTVFGIGRISGMGATNVIPDHVDIDCTFRTFDEKWRGEALHKIGDISATIAKKYGVEVVVNIVEGYPVLVNNEEITARAMNLGVELLGPDRVIDMPVRMGSEDFSFFAEKYPSMLYRTGVGIATGGVRKLHTPAFDMDESAMAVGSSTMVWLTASFIAGDEQ